MLSQAPLSSPPHSDHSCSLFFHAGDASRTQCTKHSISEHDVAVQGAELNEMSATRKAKMETLLAQDGAGPWIVTQCRLWKQVYCRGSACQTRKNLKCIGVCRLKTWTTIDGARDVGDSCDSSLCAEDSCKTQAMLD